MVLTTLLATINIIQLKYVPVETWHENQKELWPEFVNGIRSFRKHTLLKSISIIQEISIVQISTSPFPSPNQDVNGRLSSDPHRLLPLSTNYHHNYYYYCRSNQSSDCNRRVVGDKGLRTISIIVPDDPRRLCIDPREYVRNTKEFP